MGKAFEKWFESEVTKEEKGYCMIAWKAALEWAKDGIHPGDRAALILEYIEEELEGEDAQS